MIDFSLLRQVPVWGGGGRWVCDFDSLCGSTISIMWFYRFYRSYLPKIHNNLFPN